MDQRLRNAIALGVLLGGLLLALLFRHPAGRVDLPLPAGGEQLVLRKGSGGPEAPQPATATVATKQEEPRRLPPTVLAPIDGKSPPEGSGIPMSGATAHNSRWGASLGMMLPEATKPPRPVRHKIVDGDTLPALAQRYLDSEGRATEIFEANREVLSSPQLLPIGAELRIPPRQ